MTVAEARKAHDAAERRWAKACNAHYRAWTRTERRRAYREMCAAADAVDLAWDAYLAARRAA